MTVLRLCAALLAAALALPVSAALPSPPGAESPAAETVPEIAQEQDAGGDARIEARIRGIFSELPEFGTVSVAVREGVVTLEGTLPDAGTIARAEAIAGRVSGVATVENRIRRDLSIERNLSIFGQAAEVGGEALALLPLLAIAAAVAAIIGGLGYLIAGLGFLWDRIAPNAFVAEVLRTAIRSAFVIAGLVIALDMLGAGALLGALLGGAGVIGIALGFAMRDMVENYVASVMLSLRQPFRPNDLVLIDDREGRVIRLTSRATILMTLDGNHLRIPNSQVFKAVILNYTRNPQRRFDFELGVDAEDDPRAAMALGIEVLDGLAFTLDNPAPNARIVEVGDSNIVIQFFGWIDQREADWLKSRSLAIAEVKDALEEAGFALPEPIYRLRFDGRTDMLPIGRPPKEGGARRSERHAAARAQAGDTRPESEISDLVAAERRADTSGQRDLLDEDRPVE
ncbi:mechanosensitive ion channel domain-containing protein [Erythrobacter sp. HL-111]|uniref:mechanosensitive ion channel domain-containing protein n=1 Tax=Erythrobacter sp. HL-111 TaxID=1798193 RepID=UPI0006D98EA0|nr:mechanosensitive ion channel domain-containing protein [Erythrobacter sp. HL-111]KPP94067.1 MAG: small conductance mechanosensitive ion channel [Erythrobacteraceae bacterium HL-111]SDS60572.1 Small-conductance mechanosensitive channel [Erythrobacter sp. HL-111]